MAYFTNSHSAQIQITRAFNGASGNLLRPFLYYNVFKKFFNPWQVIKVNNNSDVCMMYF